MRRTITDLFEEFRMECEFSRKSRKQTLRGYEHAFAMLQRLVPDLTLELLTPQTITRFFRILHERKRIVGKGKVVSGIKRSTVSVYWCKLNSFFEWLRIRKYIDENPLRDMKRPSVVYDDKRFLSRGQIERIFAAIHNSKTTEPLYVKRNLAMFYTLLFCGLRREELILLQIRDVDLHRRILTVRAENSKIPRTRKIPLHSTVCMYMKDYLKERHHFTTPFLFVSRVRDDRLSYEGLQTLVNRIKEQSGVHFHLHRFRHTFAVNFLKSSNNVVKLKELMGHTDIKMTMVYLRCLPTKEMRSDVENMRIDDFV